MGIDLLTLFWIASALLVVGGALVVLGIGVGGAALVVWCSRSFVARQQRRIRIERRA